MKVRRGRLMIGVLLAIAVGFVVERTLASAWERAADKAWTDTGDPMDGFAGQHPKTIVSSAGHRIEEEAAKLGIHLATEGTGPHQAEGERKPIAAIREALLHFEEQTDRWPPSVLREGPPSDVSSFLSTHAAELGAIQVAATTDEIIWESDVERIPPFRGMPSTQDFRWLHDLLIADVVQKAHLGEREAALAGLEAAFRLSASLAARPELTSQFGAIVLARHELSLARMLRPTTRAWPARVALHSYRKSLLSACRYEAWALSHYVRTERLVVYLDGTIGRPSTLFGRSVIGTLASPYLRMCVANYSRIFAEAARDVQTENPCTFDAKAHDADLADVVPHWNVVGRAAKGGTIHGIGHSWASAGRVDLDAELTAALLQIEADRKGGAWPLKVPPISSAVCPGLAWTYAADADGTMSLTPSITPRSEGLPVALRVTPQR